MNEHDHLTFLWPNCSRSQDFQTRPVQGSTSSVFHPNGEWAMAQPYVIPSLHFHFSEKHATTFTAEYHTFESPPNLCWAPGRSFSNSFLWCWRISFKGRPLQFRQMVTAPNFRGSNGFCLDLTICIHGPFAITLHKNKFEDTTRSLYTKKLNALFFCVSNTQTHPFS